MFKKIASNTLAQLVAKFFGAGLTLLTTYYTIRLAGIDLYGDLTKILVLVAVGFTSIDFGLNAQGLRQGKDDLSMQKSLQNILFTRLFLSFLIIGALNLLVVVLPGGYSSQLKSIFWLASLAIIFQGIYTSGNAWFQYKLSYWRSTISVIIGSLVTTLLTFYYLKSSPTLSHLILANTLGYLTMSVSTLFLLPRLSILFPLSSVLPTLRRSLILGFILIASVLASKIDTIMLGIFRLSSEVGQYGFAYRIFDVILVLPVFVMNSLYPILLKGNSWKIVLKTIYVMGAIGVFIAIATYLSSPLIVFIKPGLSISINVIKILSFGLPFFYLTAPLMWHLISIRKEKIVLLVYASAAVFNGVSNYFFIPHYGAYAAATLTGLTELFIFLWLLYYSFKEI